MSCCRSLIASHCRLYELEGKGFLVQDRQRPLSILPGSHVRETAVIALRFTVVRLILLAEMSPARLLPMQRIVTEQFGEFEIVGHPPRIFQFLVERFPRARDHHISPKFFP